MQNPAGLPGGSFGFRLPHRLAPSPESRRLARRIVRLPTTSPAQPLPKSRRLARRIIPCKIPPARPADRSASHYITGSPSPKIPPARPADHSASHYITGSPPPQNPAASPGGSFTPKSRRLARRIVRLPTTSPARPLPKILPGCQSRTFKFGAAPNQPSGERSGDSRAHAVAGSPCSGKSRRAPRDPEGG